MYVCMYVYMYEFPDDNKQEILGLKLFNIFCYCTFKLNISVADILESMNKIFQEYFLDHPVFKLAGIQKSINKIFKKTTSKESVFKEVSSS